ncbi:D-allulose-6-phosphate 3-epimerase [Shinella sp.]|uniref:ribulose-phosphate 3-epimerase n=1 Tax=Shinella sp. TaxID=1870904 RepID=UPI0029A40311|nr:D-allulose-6-phosphate 3-epimerase [Shinella sp.]MDX3977719.1 D-allulose-6-phosphate 3-epimerase [Shinella sp.]
MRPPSDWLETLPRDRLMAEMSLWSADLARLGAEIARIDPFTDIYHIDVADGHFSPALLFFPDLVTVCRRSSAKPLHVHLMAADAILEAQIHQFADAGVDAISIHAENGNLEAGLDLIDRLGLVSGVVLQLQTPIAAAASFIERIGLLTLLGTRIGAKGQTLDPQAESRLGEARALIAKRTAAGRILLCADGGIREHTVPNLARAGAETVVMGSLAFEAADLAQRMAWLHAQPVER